MGGKPTDPNETVAHILLGEAAGEGAAGLMAVRDTMVNRMRAKKGATLHQIATAPKQFSAATRPDLTQFASRQPIIFQNLARELVTEASHPDFQPQHPYRHYVAQELWDRRDTLPKTHWLHKMQVKQRVGHHVFLEEAQ